MNHGKRKSSVCILLVINWYIYDQYQKIFFRNNRIVWHNLKTEICSEVFTLVFVSGQEHPAWFPTLVNIMTWSGPRCWVLVSIKWKEPSSSMILNLITENLCLQTLHGMNMRCSVLGPVPGNVCLLVCVLVFHSLESSSRMGYCVTHTLLSWTLTHSTFLWVTAHLHTRKVCTKTQILIYMTSSQLTAPFTQTK